jgi:hypothetical protein
LLDGLPLAVCWLALAFIRLTGVLKVISCLLRFALVAVAVGAETVQPAPVSAARFDAICWFRRHYWLLVLVFGVFITMLVISQFASMLVLLAVFVAGVGKLVVSINPCWKIGPFADVIVVWRLLLFVEPGVAFITEAPGGSLSSTSLLLLRPRFVARRWRLVFNNPAGGAQSVCRRHCRVIARLALAFNPCSRMESLVDARLSGGRFRYYRLVLAAWLTGAGAISLSAGCLVATGQRCRWLSVLGGRLNWRWRSPVITDAESGWFAALALRPG